MVWISVVTSGVGDPEGFGTADGWLLGVLVVGSGEVGAGACVPLSKVGVVVGRCQR